MHQPSPVVDAAALPATALFRPHHGRAPKRHGAIARRMAAAKKGHKTHRPRANNPPPAPVSPRPEPRRNWLATQRELASQRPSYTEMSFLDARAPEAPRVDEKKNGGTGRTRNGKQVRRQLAIRKQTG